MIHTNVSEVLCLACSASVLYVCDYIDSTETCKEKKKLEAKVLLDVDVIFDVVGWLL